MPSWSRSHALRRLTATLTAAASVAALLVAVGPAPAAVAGPAGQASKWREPVRSLTLVTGDRVRVTERADGRSTATVSPAPRADGRRPSFRMTQRGDHLYVVPQDMTSLLPDRLDPALFNVTALLDQGYGDADRGSTPLIVTYRDTAAALPATRRTRTLASVDGAAVVASKADAPRFGRALGELARRPSARSTRVGGPLARVEKIWLDRRVEANDEESAAQIGAPAVWEKGYDGAGVRVAVLDTGVDATHPDLDDRVAVAQDFTGSGSSTDRFGHGTHVASIVAGTGTASEGRHRGVAHGATLLNGKVLGDQGYGYASSVIAGMEWASTGQDADVVNMSLGFPIGSDEGGLVTEAVDRLTEQDGTLFVIAAGNNGCLACVAGPGDAPSALTVGAVDDDDLIADFSSRGPVPKTFGLKPDITAPGVAIVAARAAGTELGDPIDDDHTAMSGTSMASPHVAASAALLLQAHRDLTPEQVKARLMGTAEPTPEASVYTEGTGRVDVARAVDSTLTATPASVGYGDFTWPHDGRDPVGRTLTYRNTGDAPVTLRLTDDIRDDDDAAAPADAVTVSPDTLTVPAGGQATAEVALDTSVGDAGLFGGTVTARSGDAVVARTPVGFHKQHQMFELHVDGRARDGREAVGGFQVLDVEKGEVFAQRYWSANSSDECTDAEWAQSTCVRVPRGTYSVLGMVFTMPWWEPSQVHVAVALHTSLVGDPEVAVTKDTRLTLDARDAEEVEVETPDDHDARANLGGAVDLGMYRTPEQGEGVADRVINVPGSQVEERFFIQPTRKVRLGEFAALTRWRLEEPDIQLRTTGRHHVRLDPFYYDPTFFSDVIWQLPRLDGRRRLRVVDVGTASKGETSRADLRGALALVRRSDEISVPDQSNNAAAAGAALVAVYNDRPGADPSPGETGVRLQVPTVRLTQEEGLALIAAMRRGRLTVEAEGEPDSAFLYDLAYLEGQRVPDRLRYVADTARLASVKRRFHAQLTDEMTFGEMSFAWTEWDTLLTGTVYPLTGTPRTRMDYHVGDPRVSWDRQVMTPDPRSGAPWPAPTITLATMLSPRFTTYRPRQRTEEDWFAQPVVTGPNPRTPVARAGDVMQVAMAAMVGSDGKYATMCTGAEPADFVSAFSMYVDDELLGETDCVPQGTLAVPAKRSEYRIDYATDNSMPSATMSTRTRSTWTFHSERVSGDEFVALPMLVADYDVPLDLYNRLDARGRGHGHGSTAIGLDVGHQNGAVRSRIDDVHLSVSYDDGKRWRDVRLERTGEGRYRAYLDTRPSKHAQFVSLRLRAGDRAGNTLRQEVTRAFALPDR